MTTEEVNVTLCCPRPSSGKDPNVPIIAVSSKPVDCPPNHILIKIAKFGFSANNVTYQALGEHSHFRYFDFHPAPQTADGTSSPKTHGVIPVWGFGTVVKSTHPKIQQGERIYGYLAPTRYLLLPVSPNDVNKFSFYIPRPHLPADRRPYNQIFRCNSDPQYSLDAEALTMLYRPLFWTSFWCEDWIHSSGYRGGVSNILVSSASSKTAFCFAYLVGKRIRRGELSKNTGIIGLTSNRNVAFTRRLGLYDEVLEYDTFASAQSLQGQSGNWLYIDVASSNELNKRITSHFSSPYTGVLAAFVVLGMTNLSPTSKEIVSTMKWDENPFGTSPTVNNTAQDPTSPFWPKVEPFFMPAWLDVRRHQIPLMELLSRQNKAWKDLMVDCTKWVELEHLYGPAQVKDAYGRLSKEGLGPDKGLIWSLWDSDDKRLGTVLSRL